MINSINYLPCLANLLEDGWWEIAGGWNVSRWETEDVATVENWYLCGATEGKWWWDGNLPSDIFILQY